MRIILSVALLTAGAFAAATTTDKIALLIGDNAQVVVIGGDSREVARLAKDPRPKSGLSWLPDGEHISYVVASNEKSQPAGHLVVVDMSGNILTEVAVPQPDDGFRVDDRFAWTSGHKVRIERSANPRNCGILDLDIETTKISNWQIGACGSFVDSPDGQHVAHLGLLAITPDEDRIDSVEIDNERIVYSGGGDQIRVVYGPVWSADSKQTAFVERKVPTGEFSVTVLSLAGHFDRTPLAVQTWNEDSLIAWAGARVAVNTAGQSLLINHAQKRTENATADALAEIDRVRQARRDAEQAHTRLQKITLQYRAREATVWRRPVDAASER
jgi:hypothetical protein